MLHKSDGAEWSESECLSCGSYISPKCDVFVCNWSVLSTSPNGQCRRCHEADTNWDFVKHWEIESLFLWWSERACVQPNTFRVFCKYACNETCFSMKLVCMSLFRGMSKHIFSVFSVEVINCAAQSIFGKYSLSVCFHVFILSYRCTQSVFHLRLSYCNFQPWDSTTCKQETRQYFWSCYYLWKI